MRLSDEDAKIFSLLREDVVDSPEAEGLDGDTQNITVSKMQAHLNEYVADGLSGLKHIVESSPRGGSATRWLQTVKAIVNDVEDGDSSLVLPLLKYTPNTLDLSAAVDLLREHPYIVTDIELQNWMEGSKHTDDVVIVRDDRSDERRTKTVLVRDIAL
jgi:hypothetical protein